MISSLSEGVIEKYTVVHGLFRYRIRIERGQSTTFFLWKSIIKVTNQASAICKTSKSSIENHLHHFAYVSPFHEWFPLKKNTRL